MSDCPHRREVRDLERDAADLDRDGLMDMHTEDAIQDEIDAIELRCLEECSP